MYPNMMLMLYGQQPSISTASSRFARGIKTAKLTILFLFLLFRHMFVDSQLISFVLFCCRNDSREQKRREDKSDESQTLTRPQIVHLSRSVAPGAGLAATVSARADVLGPQCRRFVYFPSFLASAFRWFLRFAAET